MSAAQIPTPRHASCVCEGGRGLLILGPTGAGKSALSLLMMAIGATLVADDRVTLRAARGRVFASPPAALAGVIEARGAGLLRAPCAHDIEIALIARIGGAPTKRIPLRRYENLLGARLPLISIAKADAIAAAMLLAALRCGGPLDPESPPGAQCPSQEARR